MNTPGLHNDEQQSNVSTSEKKEWITPKLMILDIGNDTENGVTPASDSFGNS